MKAIVTVIGRDRVGIIALVSQLLAGRGVNVLDISQTVLQTLDRVLMLVDASACTENFAALARELAAAGEEHGIQIRIQREDIFNAMHKI